MRCEIDDARLFLQVIRERRDALEVLREALSNSHDAGATRVTIVVKGASAKLVDVEIHDNGRGIRPSEFRFFFGLGFGNKTSSLSIGNKGLGTKLFFNSDRVEVTTRLATGGAYRALLEHPLVELEHGRVPKYRVTHTDRLPSRFKHGASILIGGLRANARSPSLSGENIANYLRWYTVAGSCREILSVTGAHRMDVRLVRRGAQTSEFRIDGHRLPNIESSEAIDYQGYARTFEPFSFELRDDEGSRLGTLEIAGAIVGPEGHVVKDRRIKKRFKGVFLAKDYFIVRSVNTEVFAGTGEWQNMHIVANCQQLDLSMNRDDFIDIGAGSVYEEAISALRGFANAVRRGQPLAYRGSTVEARGCFAGARYFELKSLQRKETQVENHNLRALDLLALSSVPRTILANDGGPVYQPIDAVGVTLLFQALVSKNQLFYLGDSVDRSVRYRILGHSGGSSGSLILQKQQAGAWSSPLFYKSVLRLRDMNARELAGVDGIVCWETGGSTHEGIDALDIVVLKNHTPDLELQG